MVPGLNTHKNELNSLLKVFTLILDIIPAPDVPIERFQGKVPEKDLEYESGPPGPGKKWFPGQNKRGYKQKVKNAEQKWPEIHNLFWEEHLIQEDLTHAGYKRREKSWHQVNELKNVGKKRIRHITSPSLNL